jgi:predicted ATP-binding protein involved in virulence
MIKREEFPYLQSFVINDAYAVKNLSVPVYEGSDFKHLILTGKNGSGKTTVLRALADIVQNDANNGTPASAMVLSLKSSIASANSYKSLIDTWQQTLDKLDKVSAVFSSAIGHPYAGFMKMQSEIITAFFGATRKIQVREVTTITKEADLVSQLAKNDHQDTPAALFKQYLVNKKVFQVFEVMEGNQEAARQQETFFSELEELLAEIFESPGLKLEFVRESFEFYIKLPDGRRITFNQLSAGFSSFLSILTDLLLRIDLLRKQASNYSYDPCGFVFIDEPETHAHLEMQYQILPWLTRLFPNLQFIVATHSPAVASSIKNATVFDLSTRQILGDEAAGSSYSELMQTHFGLANEYSNVADKIILEVKRIAKLDNTQLARKQLKTLLENEDRYLSAVLRLEIEALLMGLDDQSTAA